MYIIIPAALILGFIYVIHRTDVNKPFRRCIVPFYSFVECYSYARRFKLRHWFRNILMLVLVFLPLAIQAFYSFGYLQQFISPIVSNSSVISIQLDSFCSNIILIVSIILLGTRSFYVIFKYKRFPQEVIFMIIFNLWFIASEGQYFIISPFVIIYSENVLISSILVASAQIILMNVVISVYNFHVLGYQSIAKEIVRALRMLTPLSDPIKVNISVTQIGSYDYKICTNGSINIEYLNSHRESMAGTIGRNLKIIDLELFKPGVFKFGMGNIPVKKATSGELTSSLEYVNAPLPEKIIDESTGKSYVTETDRYQAVIGASSAPQVCFYKTVPACSFRR